MTRISVKAAEVDSKKSKDRLKEAITTLCYHYPQYTYEEAMKLPLKMVKRMLKVARGEKARDYLEMAQIARVAQSTKPGPYTTLVKRYEREING